MNCNKAKTHGKCVRCIYSLNFKRKRKGKGNQFCSMRTRLSKKSFVGFYMARDADLSRLRRSRSAALRPKKVRSARLESRRKEKTFLCRCFARLHVLWRKMSYVVSFTFFSLPLIFILHWWPLAFLILSPPLQNFHVVLPTKKCLLCFLSLALNLCRPFSR